MSIEATAEIQATKTESSSPDVQAMLSKSVPASGIGVVGNATFASMGEFEAQYPELYEAFIYGWSLQAVNDAKNANDRVIQAIKEGQRQS
jgi:hypothetical protein